MHPIYITKKNLESFINLALIEDIQDGDHSTLSTIAKEETNQAKLWVKENGILAGIEMAKEIFTHYDSNLNIKVLKHDGEVMKVGDIAFIVEGSARSILTTERLVLNCMQRMSGIATLTHKMNQEIIHTNAKLLDTRKTTPNFRICEKWAVAIGGGTNHRYGLFDMIMLKDNHIDFAGGITKAVNMAKKYLVEKNLTLKIEVETRNLDEVKEAIAAKVDRIMLDNFSLEETQNAVKFINNRCETEASGGITLETLKPIAEIGVNFISVGALTHSAKNIDLSLKAT